MSKFTCPNGHEHDRAVVCGGDQPYFTHWAGEGDPNEEVFPNVYFLMEIPSGKLTKELHSEDVPFELTDGDWADMHDHAKGGCASEPQCLTCLEYLEVEGDE
jgi:hypothetical protein